MTAVVSDGLPAPRTGNSPLALFQRVGRSLMLPIAVLPAAALLLRLGQPDVLGADGLSKHVAWVNPVANVMATAGNALFSWLPLLFAVGVAIGFARKADGSTALAAVVGYMTFHYVSMYVFYTNSAVPTRIKDSVTQFTGGSSSGVANPDGTFTVKALSTPSLNMGASNPTYVLGGIIVGIITALLFQRYYRIKLPPYLAFFGGRRFVPIVTAATCVVLGVVMAFAWIPVSAVINWGGNEAIKSGALGAGIFGVVNRALLPFGLHHIVNSVAWFTVGDYTNPVTKVVTHGDLTRFFAGDRTAGQFMTGFFPVMMFGLPAAAIAMWQAARVDRRKAVGGILLAGALTSFLTGVTEPLEFSFLFVAPVLFGIHAVLTGISLAVVTAMGIHDGFGFSAGFIDFVINYGKAQNPLLLLVVGVAYAVIYYAIFSFAIRKWNLMTPGREPDEVAGIGSPDDAAIDLDAGSRAGSGQAVTT
ncbi:MAG: N-acetylglucosamine system or component [Frankiaceae bacterium]|nr:N-acetylglucosamine system or component [Frankiaceae bacterium]